MNERKRHVKQVVTTYPNPGIKKLVVCMTTHDRLDCARINQEIIKLNYRTSIPIIHACSGSGYSEYLEDVLIDCQPEELKSGALSLLKKSIQTAISMYSPEYIVHLEGDTWIMDEKVIHKIINAMQANPSYILAASAWDGDALASNTLHKPKLSLKLRRIVACALRWVGIPYKIVFRDSLATQFFVFRTDKRMIQCIMDLQPCNDLYLEQSFFRMFMRYFREKNLFRLHEREPVHPANRFVSEKLSLFSQHWPARGTAINQFDSAHPLFIADDTDGKKETLLRFPDIRQGGHLQKLLLATNYDYYNPGAIRC
jgi:hypothetical protein